MSDKTSLAAFPSRKLERWELETREQKVRELVGQHLDLKSIAAVFVSDCHDCRVADENVQAPVRLGNLVHLCAGFLYVFQILQVARDVLNLGWGLSRQAAIVGHQKKGRRVPLIEDLKLPFKQRILRDTPSS